MGRCVMGIPLNSILNLTEDQVENSKIELNITYKEGNVSFIDLWTGHSEEERKAVDPCVTCYCGWPAGKKHNFREGQWVFSFIQLGDNRDRWLFASAAKALSVPEGGPTEVEVLTEYAPLFGRLIINYHKKQGQQLYIYKLKTVLDNTTVEEILPDLYDGEAFHGYDDVRLPFAKLDRIFRREIMPSYHDALEGVTGVYCLTDTKTGRLYIGSATGEGGVAARWGSYLDTKHGGNKKLRELYEREGEEYFKRYFEFTLLEYFGMSYDPDKVRNREQWWKRCLRTREHGYNDN